MTIVAQFDVAYYQILNHEGKIIADLPDFAKDPKQLIELYRWMILNRVFDAKAIALQRTGKMGTYPSTRGQEGAFIGVGSAMAKNDVFVPYYRDVGIMMQRGVKLSEILLYWGGDERGNCYANNAKDFPYSVPVGSQPLHAVGVATAMQIRGEKNAALTMCGDGATSQGDFYEAMNVAGIWQLPVVFVVCNNQWAISVPRSAQTAAQTIAQKAIAAGFSGEQVDGNDIIAVRHRVELALKKARDNYQPTLIEILCYRQCDHTTADDAKRYESQEIREGEWQKEPVARLRRYLEHLGVWTAADEEKCLADAAHQVDQAVNEYLQILPEPPEVMFDYLYARLPEVYLEQRESVKNSGGKSHHG